MTFSCYTTAFAPLFADQYETRVFWEHCGFQHTSLTVASTNNECSSVTTSYQAT